MRGISSWIQAKSRVFELPWRCVWWIAEEEEGDAKERE